jgi:flagellar biosynthesis/type III secretory pathway M-ring protein FliF/YscJ
MGTPSTSIGPGLGAFVAFFVLAVILWFLMRNLNGRMRRMAYKEQQRVAELEAQQAERDQPSSGPKATPEDARAQAPTRADPAP